MPPQETTYRARTPKESSGWYEQLLKKLERGNKFLTFRLLGKLLRIKSRNTPVPLEEVSSVLIIRYDALGDMVVTTPLWRILKQLKPSIRIGVAGSYKNLALLRADKDVDITYDYSASSMREFIKLSKETRKQKWDVVIACNFVDRTRNAVISRLAAPNGITASIGKAGKEGADKLFSRYIVLPESPLPMPMVSKLQYLLRAVIALPEQSEVRPSIMIDPISEQDSNARLNYILQREQKLKYIIINTEAPIIRKWELSKNISLAKFISDHFAEYVTFLTSMPEYQSEIEILLNNSQIKRVCYFPTKDIHDLTTLIRRSSLIITPDTSVAHIASAENKPIVGLYNVANDWLPYKIPAVIILSGKNKSIQDIPVELVSQGVTDMLTNPPIDTIRIIDCDFPDSFEERSF